MSGVRVLVGTKKGAFVLSSDDARSSWDVTGPHFPGREVYHVKGSAADPEPHLRRSEWLVRAFHAAFRRWWIDVARDQQ